MKHGSVFWLMMYCAVAMGAEQTTTQTHTFQIPVPHRSKSISLNVINDNGHTITQYNSSNLRVDTASLPTTISGQSGLLSRAISYVWSNKFTFAVGITFAGYTALLSALLYLEHLLYKQKVGLIGAMSFL